MSIVTFKDDLWLAECHPDDGGRISRLRFDGHDLLTSPPPPTNVSLAKYGSYETRLVYGYDDCFPTVAPCRYPDLDWDVPDHGELCWLAWEVQLTSTGLCCSALSTCLPIHFTREMVFYNNVLTWKFTVRNIAECSLPFLHVMHPLMPLNRVTRLVLPGFERCVDEVRAAVEPHLASPEVLAEHLKTSRPQIAFMYLLQGVKSGQLQIELDHRITIAVRYMHALFPTLGIWWNRDGYPDKATYHRNECAFEPIAGTSSDLEQTHSSSSCMRIAPRQTVSWQVEWNVTCR